MKEASKALTCVKIFPAEYIFSGKLCTYIFNVQKSVCFCLVDEYTILFAATNIGG